LHQDKTIACRDCQTEFIFTAQQQIDFEARGFNPPSRCPECHKNRSARRRHTRGGDTVMHTAPCAACGKEAALPFKPSGDKPIYCDECYKAKLDGKAKPPLKEFVLRQPEVSETTTAEAVQAAVEAPAEDAFAVFNLDPRLQRAIRDAGFDAPTPVQAATIPIGLEGRDIVGTAQTGTGKTAAFVLPILQHILENPSERPRTRAIVLTPTRELAEQVNDVFKQLGKHTKIRSASVYGGVGFVPQVQALRNGTEIIVACPGRLLDHMERGNTDFSNTDKVVLDEADRMLDMGFLPPIKRILGKLPRNRHTMLFSATFAPELNRLAKENLNKPERIEVDLHAPAKTVAHALYPCPQHLKTALVVKLLEKIDTNSVLVFIRTRHRASRVAEQIHKAGFSAASLHADRSQNQRQAALDDFRSGRCQVLVATDIAARGLDVETISHVINYDIPDTADAYIHRIGRTGRAERTGDALTLITNDDVGMVWEIEKVLGGPIERVRLDDFDYSAPTRPGAAINRNPMPSPGRRPAGFSSYRKPKMRLSGDIR
jgi:ATP-dependent RNA helicase RhlE